MFPNPQAALPLPPRPNLEQYKKQAKDLVKACKSGETEAIATWSRQWLETLAHLLGQPDTPPSAQIERRVKEVAEFAQRKLGDQGAQCALADAQFVIARSHGFESWPKFTKHLAALARQSSPISTFEAAADALVSGDLATLEQLLHAQPELIRAHSTREHRATLLHYVSANGVEGYRQKTPPNAVQIAELLLKAGAEVDATANVYGGDWTTLGLTATSSPPLQAGVQSALLELLLKYGAAVGGAPRGHCLVVECLANGCPGAAEFLAQRGAPLDVEGAAAMGQLELVKSFFNVDGSLKASASQAQMESGFLYACGGGHASVVEFLLQQGAEAGTQNHASETGLHWAAYGGHADVVKLLLERNAPVNVKDKSYDGTPLGWALYAWGEASPTSKLDGYYEIVERLVAAGATVEPEWLADPDRGIPLMEKVRNDPRLRATLSNMKQPAEDLPWPVALPELERGSFSRLAPLFDQDPTSDSDKCRIIEWYEQGYFDSEPKALAEALTCACFLGRTSVAEFLLNQGVDPAAGIGTGLAAFHWAANRGNLETVKLLIERNAPLEQENMYGGTVLGCAVWSAFNEPRADHLPIIEALIAAGAKIEPGWNQAIDELRQGDGAEK